MIFDALRLDGKVAIVTGGNSNLGRHMCLALAEAGADIVACARTLSEVEETATQVRKLGRKALAIRTDITRSSDVDALVKQSLDAFGQIDILVNNAAHNIVKPLVPLPGFHPKGAEEIPNYFSPISDEEWRGVVDPCLTGPFYTTRAVGPHMLERRKGRVINISSVRSIKVEPYTLPYDVAKAGLNMFTKVVAREWARYNVTVNAITPGRFLSKGASRDHNDPRLYEKMLKEIPMGRVGEPRELALLVVYLSSDAAGYITGQIYGMDGGRTIL